jgi:hypothetical protein
VAAKYQPAPEIRIGPCQNCNQRSEIREDADGRWVCENCSTAGTPLAQRQAEQRAPLAPAPGSRRDALIDYIVLHATPQWVERFQREFIADLRLKLVTRHGWITELEKEHNERILLRWAGELGYPGEVRQPPQPRQDLPVRRRRLPAATSEGLGSDDSSPLPPVLCPPRQPTSRAADAKAEGAYGLQPSQSRGRANRGAEARRARRRQRTRSASSPQATAPVEETGS